MLPACSRETPAAHGGFAGASQERGHLLRQPPVPRGPPVIRRAHVVIAGAGIAGLAAARALRQRGIDDLAMLELEDTAGGNSRPAELGGIACPLGAHYLPVPDDHAPEVQHLLEEFGLRRREAGRWVYDERHLCHAPQERLFFQGQWQDGILPLAGVGATTLAQYIVFAQEVERARATRRFTIPLRERQHLLAWDAERFDRWLDRHGFDDPQLRWYLDYCCRDDYGAGISTVSAWAGLHYFASRHGFHPPGMESGGEREALLTWPEGNGWLARKLAAPLEGRMHTGRVVLRVAQQRHGVEVDAYDAVHGRHERWLADHAVVALPAFVAARVVENPSDPLRGLAARIRMAPWLVVNLRLAMPPRMAPGSSMAWDNVVHGSQQGGLGYVVATHQSLNPMPGATVLSWYCAPGEAARAEVLRQPWTHWRDLALSHLQEPHPDLEHKLTQVEVARYGHAMSIPVPGTLARLPQPPHTARLHFAHADWAGYSIFEEAFTLGHRTAARVG